MLQTLNMDSFTNTPGELRDQVNEMSPSYGNVQQNNEYIKRVNKVQLRTLNNSVQL